MKHKLLAALALSAVLLPTASRAGDDDKWTFENSIYLFGAGMSGDVTVKGVTADLNVDFSDVLQNLEFGAMGSLRASRGALSLNLDVIYTGLGASKGPVSGDLDQWVVEPTLSYRVSKHIEPFVGVRYNNLGGEIRGPFGILPTGTQDWFDPIVGANFTFPLNEKLSLNARGDVGGFGVGSDLTWQAFPYLNWRISERCSLQAGYRWVSNDYESGSGANRFAYDVLTQGPQIGLTIKL